MNGMTSGRAAGRAGVNVETLRYYERRGLIPRPQRTVSNYRIYSEATVRRIRFIKHAQDIGFTLAEIKELLSLRATRGARCADVRKRAEAKIRDIERRMRDLEAMKTALADLVAGCSGRGALKECSILDALDEEEP